MKFIKIFVFLLCSVSIYSQEFPYVGYIISKDGLNQREAPSATSNRIGTLLYGSRVIVLERNSNVETIDGIKDYWYKCSYGGTFWLFGGYLSKEVPDDIGPIIGYWNTNRGERYYWNFQSDNIARSGRKETDVGWVGTWMLLGNKLTIETRPTEFSTGENQIIEITVTIINRDRMFFQFTDGNGEFLDRNKNIF